MSGSALKALRFKSLGSTVTVAWFCDSFLFNQLLFQTFCLQYLLDAGATLIIGRKYICTDRCRLYVHTML